MRPVTATLPSGGSSGISCGLIEIWRSMSCVHGSETSPLAQASETTATPSTTRPIRSGRFNAHLLGPVGAQRAGDRLGLVAAARHPDAEAILGEARVEALAHLRVGQAGEEQH